ncbi:MAG: chemotaxis protein CheD [Burkholderiaceae bacterium]|nr:chemotaxis protein CheD [Burkholderiaceae bacterium]
MAVTAPVPAPLHPGDVACGNVGEQFETLLGSCVSVILTDPRRTIGAMCHIVHSRPALPGTRTSGAYGDEALRMMYAQLQGRGIAPGQCEAYVYGGGNMFPEMFSQKHVGQANSDWVLDALANDGIAVIREDVGGALYRRLSWTVGADRPRVQSVPV